MSEEERESEKSTVEELATEGEERFCRDKAFFSKPEMNGRRAEHLITVNYCTDILRLVKYVTVIMAVLML